jgi:hypothetical protein
MNLYQWESSTLRSYANGSIISFGKNKDDARKRAKVAIEKRWAHNQRYVTDLLNDIKGEPEEVNDNAIFIIGSD